MVLAKHLLAKGDGAQAESFYQRLLDDSGDFPQAKLQLELARALALQGKKSDAIKLYLQIAQENKKDPIAHEAVTQLAKQDLPRRTKLRQKRTGEEQWTCPPSTK